MTKEDKTMKKVNHLVLASVLSTAVGLYLFWGNDRQYPNQ